MTRLKKYIGRRLGDCSLATALAWVRVALHASGFDTAAALVKSTSQNLAALKMGLRPDEAAEVIGSEQIMREMIAAGWIAPVVQRHKLTLYDRSQLCQAWARLVAGETLTKAR